MKPAGYRESLQEPARLCFSTLTTSPSPLTMRCKMCFVLDAGWRGDGEAIESFIIVE